MDSLQMLNEVKLRLGIGAEDKDAILTSYLDEILDKIMLYCNRANVPAKLHYTAVSMAVDLYNLKNPGERQATEERQGNRSIKYTGKNDVEAVVSGYTAALNRFRRTRVM